MDQAIVEVRVCRNNFSLGCLGIIVWFLTALFAMVVISEVLFKIGYIYDFAFLEICVVHGCCKSLGV